MGLFDYTFISVGYRPTKHRRCQNNNIKFRPCILLIDGGVRDDDDPDSFRENVPVLEQYSNNYKEVVVFYVGMHLLYTPALTNTDLLNVKGCLIV